MGAAQGIKQETISDRRELWFVVALTVLAAALRFWSFNRMGLTHFDEGVYAIAGLWPFSQAGLRAIDPQLIAYAPPGFPLLVGLVYLFVGVSDTSALLPALIIGVFTIPVVAWLGRRSFGPGAGPAAATFAAFSLAHVAFSRKALTDVPFLLAWLVALGLGGRLLERPRFARAIGVGLAVGLAQNLKYNGWLAGAIVSVAWAIGIAFTPETRNRLAALRTFGLLIVAAVIAGICYAPWFWFVESQPGGYAALMRHHRSYLGGVHSWWPFLELQLAQTIALSGGPIWTSTTWCIAFLSYVLASKQPLKSWPEAFRLAIGLAGGGIVLAIVPDFGWWIGFLMVAPLLASASPAPRLLGTSWFVLSAMTPFYHPYARLWLPLHSAGWLMFAGAIDRLARAGWDRSARPRRFLPGLVCWIAAILDGSAFTGEIDRREQLPVAAILQPTDDLRLFADSLLDHAPASLVDGTPIHILGRRSLVFYLASMQRRFRHRHASSTKRPSSTEPVPRRIGRSWTTPS